MKDYDTTLPMLVKFKIPDQFTVIQGSEGNKMAILEYRVGSAKWKK